MTAIPQPHPKLGALIDALGDVPVVTEAATVRKRSRDFFWYSPILNAQLHGKSADVLVSPRTEAEVMRVAAACARFGVPITPRGAATGNYGQAVPLHGGVLLDLSGLTEVEWVRGGVVRCGPGLVMSELDAMLAPQGLEQRLHPSTKRRATVGGFVAGGSGGIGSITYGGLREPGNIRAARIVTVEPEPHAIELRGDAAQKVNRAYGTTGIITALEMPLAPAWPWVEMIVAFDTFAGAMAFGHAAALADGIVKKLIAPIAWPLPSFFAEVRPFCPEGRAVLIVMVAEASVESFKALLGGDGDITLERPASDAPGQTPLYEYTWNHTTLQMLKADRGVTYLQCLFPHDRVLESVGEMCAMFPEELLGHCEFIRFGGRVTASALPVIRFSTPERLDAIMALHEAHGVMIANPHVMTLEDGSRHKRADADQIGFKREVDPMGLLNPGKMRSFVPAPRA
ncbi:FAD-binding oxidoreductase [Lichenibacterium ramalinae]|uniref:FAD-binding oxidoreductase n=1 Tax=Lichenibacterium ramalinae TaxID=2316527 RepID=A0A4Q2RAE4_9HYPH|nr:FAD-binding oxidoreductase [Lichenibacterium ramalinae]RYB02572.1 FAD-binding oxidoreductase [Lichenibacterium ramalinae]